MLVSLNPKIPTTVSIYISTAEPQMWQLRRMKTHSSGIDFGRIDPLDFGTLFEVQVSLSLAGHGTRVFEKLDNITTEPHYGTYGTPSGSVRAISSLLSKYVIAVNSSQLVPAFILF
jgi:hypothetical protein